jgi:hypothetical protein
MRFAKGQMADKQVDPRLQRLLGGKSNNLG